MRVVYNLADQTAAGGKSIGILNVSLNLLPELAACPDVELDLLANASLAPLLPVRGNVHIHRHDAPSASKLRRMAWDQLGLYNTARALQPDWLFLPKGFASFTCRYRGRLAAYVHDTMAAFYAARYPGFYPRAELAYFQHSLRATLRQAELIFTNTQFTADELGAFADASGLCTPRTVVAGIGFSQTTGSVPPTGRRGLLALASPWPHKKTAMAVAFLERWCASHAFDEPVQWIGRLPDGIALPPRPGWSHRARLTPDELEEAMRACRAVVVTSEYEGFGMPPVEAALAGACPVYSDIPVTREVMGETPARFANDDYASFDEAMQAALAMNPATLANWAARLRERHNWPLVASRITGALQRR